VSSERVRRPSRDLTTAPAAFEELMAQVPVPEDRPAETVTVGGVDASRSRSMELTPGRILYFHAGCT